MTALSQQNIPDMNKPASNLDSLFKDRTKELVYIQSSKNIYEAGEDLWFKAYMLDPQYFVPSTGSQTFYLQMVHQKSGQVVWQEKYEVQNAFVSGHVFLQDSLAEGDYLLEAFTSNSFYNDSSEFKALRRINVRKNMDPRPFFTADFDKLQYKKGDTINVTISARSKNEDPLYAEIEAILMQGDNILARKQAVTNAGGQAGLTFLLKNSGEGLRLQTSVKYADQEKQLDFPVPFKNGSPVRFNTFPEGGYLISGIKNNVAFKAVNIDGNPLDVTGILFEDEQPLLEIKSMHAGMGCFNFTPKTGKNYHIRLSGAVTDRSFSLPSIAPEGITMRLDGRDSDYVNFIVSQSPGMPGSTVYLRGQIRGIVYCMAGGHINRELKIKIPTKEFPQQGIAEFTLFGENLLPIAERLVYIHPQKKLYIQASLDKDKYETRGKAVLKIKTTDEDGEPVRANLGVSVYDQLYQKPDDPKNILTHCLLSEQLKGSIYNPVYYFDEKNKDRSEALDLLLLTQGWRKYVWTEDNREIKDRQPIVRDGIEGEVHFTKKLKQSPKGVQVVMVFNPGKENLSEYILTDSLGKFTVNPVHLKTWQGDYVYLKPLGPTDFEPRISLSDPFQKINEAIKTKKTGYPSNSTDIERVDSVPSFIAGPNVIELDEVNIKGKRLKPFRDKYMGRLDSIAKLDLCPDYVGKCGLLNCPACKTGTKPIEGKTYSKWISSRDPGPHTFYFRAEEMETVVYHYPQFTAEELLKMNNLYRLKAYYGKREFYQPGYDTKTENEFMPDARNTLLWAPSVITNDQGEATLEFFCSDVNAVFVVNMEGVSENGLLGMDGSKFKVWKTKPFKWEN